MCEHDHHGFSRRQFGSLFLGAAGLSLLPAMARASEIEALAVTCIDYRFYNKDTAFVANDLSLFKEADNVALAGASLAGVSKMFAKSVPAFWEQVGIAKSLHHIKKVVLIDHRECGAYNAEFGVPRSEAEETAQHVKVMTALAREFEARRLGLALEFFLMPLKGCAEQLQIAATAAP
jgi:carbonic anhydrase